MPRVGVVGLALLFAQTGLALGAGPASGTYVGRTSQGHPIQLEVRDGKVVSLSYTSSFTCTPTPIAQPVQRTAAASSLTISGGKFGGKVEVTPEGTTVSDSTTIEGVFSGSKVSGTFSELWKAGPAKTCRDGTVSFTASAG